MNKKVFIVIAVLLALCSCERAAFKADVESGYRLDALRFDFVLEREEPVKGVRNGWVSGDRVFIFFGGVSTAYLTLDYESSSWGTAVLHIPDGGSAPSLGDSGVLTAVYLPYGNNLEPTWNSVPGAWEFLGGATDYYFLRAEKATYYITDTNDQLATLGAFIFMENSEEYVQFFIPDDSASGTLQFACNALLPAGISGVSLDGTVTDKSLTQGAWITARADTIDDEKGYYASGRLALQSSAYYYFALEQSGTCRHFFKQRNDVIYGHTAYQLPAIEDWASVTSSTLVEIAGNRWMAMNSGASAPWEQGFLYSSSEKDNAVEGNTMIPSDGDWTRLLDRTKTVWLQMTIAGTDGYLVLNRDNSSNYIFLPESYYWSSSVVSDIQHYFVASADEGRELRNTTPPATACVRLVSSLTVGDITPPVDGGDL